MARAIVFKQANASLGRPPGLTKEQCRVLPIFTDGQMCISCWKLTEEERARVAEEGVIYAIILTGQPTQPPIKLAVDSPFEHPMCEKCSQRHQGHPVQVKCSACYAPFMVDSCVYHADCELGAFTCPSCDELQNEFSDEDW